jgi:hypothetical protein
VTCTVPILYSTSDLPWDRKAFKIGREDIRGEFILVFFVLSLYLDRREGDDEEQQTERERIS